MRFIGDMSNDELTFEYRDEFEREPIAKKIAQLLKDDEFSPMVLDGDWGVGKTEFCHKLIHLMQDDLLRCQCLYIDAFAEDHGDDPLLMLLGNIASFIKNKKGNGDSVAGYEKLRKASLAVAKSCVQIGVKTGMAWFLRQNVDDIGKELSEAVRRSAEEGLDALVDMSFQQYEEAKSNIETLKRILEEIAKDERLIVIVDEFDRCRPDFAIALLEKIKHVFDVPNVSFLLVANMRQLEAVISHVYWNGADVSRYIDKFVKIIVSLPIYYRQRESIAQRYLRVLEEKNKMPIVFERTSYKVIIHILKTNSHSLRDVEHFSRYCNVLHPFFLEDIRFSAEYVQILAIISIYCCCFKRDFVKNFNVGYIDVEFIVDLFNLKDTDIKGDTVLQKFRNIVECLDPSINETTGIGDRQFLIYTREIFSLDTDNSFEQIRKIFIELLMNLSLVRI